MNFKKFKKSLVSIVLGSSLFLVNGGVICQQPKARFTDEFINSEIKKYQKFPEMIKIIKVLKFFSDFRKKPENENVSNTLLDACEKNLDTLIKIKPENRTNEWFCRFILNFSFYLALCSDVPLKVTLLTDITYPKPATRTTEELFKQLYVNMQHAAGQLNINCLVQKEITSIFEIANYKDEKTLTDLYKNVINLLNSEEPTAFSTSTSYCTHNTHQDAFITKTLEKLDVD